MGGKEKEWGRREESDTKGKGRGLKGSSPFLLLLSKI